MRIRTAIKPIGVAGGVYHADFLADTGSIDSMAPASELRRVGIEPRGRCDYELADGSVRELEFGFAEFDVLGRTTVGRVVFGSEDAEPLLGVTALESAGFEIDPARQTLRRLRMRL